MPVGTKKSASDLTPFERFVQGILRVPKAAIDEAEAKRVKRDRQEAGK